MVKTVLYVHVNALWGGGASILRGDLTEDLLRYEFGGGGAYTWRGLFSEIDSSTLIQYKNVILLYLARDSLIKILWYLKGTEA